MLVKFAKKYLNKGTNVTLSGRMHTGSYTNKDGQKVYTTEVVADEIEFAESKNSSSSDMGGNGGFTPQAAPTAAPANDGLMNIPDGIDEELPFN